VPGPLKKKEDKMSEQKEMSLLNLYVMTYEQAQQLRLETMNRMRCWLRDTIPKEDWSGKNFSDKQVMENEELPLDIRQIVTDNLGQMEKDTKKMMKRALKNHPLWPWLKDTKGISIILAARLLHRIDGKEFPQVSNLWSYAGLDGSRWKGKPHNWELTSVCYLIGKSFVLVGKGGKYRKIYEERKEYEKTKPACDKCKETRAKLEGSNTEKDRERLEKWIKGQCSPGHIDNKARRYAVKEFLKDLWAEMANCSGQLEQE
jgi:hypothetical protein